MKLCKIMNKCYVKNLQISGFMILFKMTESQPFGVFVIIYYTLLIFIDIS